MQNQQSQYFNYGARSGYQKPQQTPFGNVRQSSSKVNIFGDYKIKQPVQNNRDQFYQVKASHVSGSQIQIQKSMPKGLVNIGNNCYMNAILQMLFCLEQFRTQLFSESNQSNKITQSLILLFSQMKSRLTDPINPHQFHTLFLQQHKQFTFGRQEDAHEFLLSLFSSLGFENRKPVGFSNFFDEIKNFFSEIFGNNENLDEIIEKEWKKKREVETNIVTDLFVGMFSNELTCKNCTYRQVNYEEFNVLALSLENCVGAIQLTDLMRLQFKVQTINNYKCPKCTKEDHSLRQKIAKQPKILIIQLKRFNYLDQALRINTNIIFPFQNLSLIEQCTTNNKTSEYNLTAIVHHSGSCNNGHYYATCKNKENQQDRWFRFDDSLVDEIQIEKRQYDTFGTPTPYMLVYEQK